MKGIEDESDAAQKYDKLAILLQGISAKTNFEYSKNQILNLLENEEEIRYVFD